MHSIHLYYVANKHSHNCPFETSVIQATKLNITKVPLSLQGHVSLILPWTLPRQPKSDEPFELTG